MREAASFVASQLGKGEAGLLNTLLHTARQAYQSWKSRRQISTLSEFDDHLLADLGLTRGDIAEALELPFSHDPGRELQIRAARRNRRGWNA